MRISNPKLIELCDAHITRFHKLIERQTNVNLSECGRYLGIWDRGRAWAKQQPEDTSHTEASITHDSEFRGEVLDALGSGEYDAYFEDFLVFPEDDDDA